MRRAIRFIPVGLLVAIALAGTRAPAQPLRVATVNVWSGLDYRGSFSMGEYESAETREKRLAMVIDGLRAENPDLIALQECNPVGAVASRVARELGFDVEYVRVNGGVKIGGVGFPTNLDEGIALLARSDLHLRLVEVIDLSHGFGVWGDVFSAHLAERNAAIHATIDVGGITMHVFATHLIAAVPVTARTIAACDSIGRRIGADSAMRARTIDHLRDRESIQEGQVAALLERIDRLRATSPVILLGDFNAAPESPVIRAITDDRIVDAAAQSPEQLLTWEPRVNPNIRCSTDTVDARGRALPLTDRVSAWFDAQPRRIDHVFLAGAWEPTDAQGARRILEGPRDGIFASDHFGLLVDLDTRTAHERAVREPAAESSYEGMPILTYDTDVGVGYGLKLSALNMFRARESLDLLAFNSSKGERWYRFVAALPDIETRQGTVYPIAVDFIVDFDKYLNNNFYGIGNTSAASNRTTYVKAPLDLTLQASRGFASTFVAQIGAHYRTVSTTMGDTIPESTTHALGLFVNVRYDSRDSYVSPSRGAVAELDWEEPISALAFDYANRTVIATLQGYQVVCYPRTVLAVRVMGEKVAGNAVPWYGMASLGGNRTLRGYPQDRFLDRVMLVTNAELRFPVFWRFGGVAGIDAGSVFSSISDVNLDRWPWNYVAGLRFHFDTFVVRLDLGFSREQTGVYLNFGEVF